MPPTNHPYLSAVQGSRDSSVPNGGPTPMEVENGNGLTITASLCESPRVARRNQAVSSGDAVTVCPKPGDKPTTFTVLKQDTGKLQVVRDSVDSQAAVLGTITIGDANETTGGLRPFTPQQPVRPDPVRRTFQIFVMNLLQDSRTSTFYVESNYLVETLKDMIYKKLGIPRDQQHLTYAGKNLVTGKTLEYYDIKECSTVTLTGRLRGG